MNVTGIKAEIGAEVPLADTEAAVHPAQAETGAEVPLADTEAAAHPTEIAAEVITAAVTGAPEAANAAVTAVQAAVTEEVSAAEAADRVPPDGIPVTVSTEETDLPFF